MFSCQLNSTTCLHPALTHSLKWHGGSYPAAFRACWYCAVLSIHIPEGILALDLYRAKAFEGPHPTHSKRKNIALTAAFVFGFAEDSSASIKSDAVSPTDNNKQA